MGDLLISPFVNTGRVNPNHDVVVLAHNSIGTQINIKYRKHQLDTIHNPLPAVFEVKTGQWIRPAAEGAPHASGNALVIRYMFN